MRARTRPCQVYYIGIVNIMPEEQRPSTLEFLFKSRAREDTAPLYAEFVTITY